MWPIADREIDLIQRDGVPIFLPFVRRTFQELLVIRILVDFMETSRETEICKFDMATFVEKDVVRLDVAGKKSVQGFDGKANFERQEPCWSFGNGM